MGGEKQYVPSQSAGNLAQGTSMPQLTIEVSSPPAVRDAAVVAVDGGAKTSPAEARKPAAESVKTEPARWPQAFFNFG
jgi:hypothetical protein